MMRYFNNSPIKATEMWATGNQMQLGNPLGVRSISNTYGLPQMEAMEMQMCRALGKIRKSLYKYWIWIE